jgi:hypothetical protein
VWSQPFSLIIFLLVVQEVIGQPRRAEFELVAHFAGEETWSERRGD